jgi:hypothetical protein
VATSNPANGTVDPTNDGQIVYVPNENFHGVDTFTYVIRDPSGAESDATVTVVVRSVNDDPVAREDQASTPEDTAVTINVLANDTDVDGDSLTVEVVGGPNGGEAVVNNDGTVTYTPAPGFSGQDVFTYTVDDGNGGTDISQVFVFVESVNDPPVANNDQVVTDEDTPVTIDVLANDSDDDGDVLTIVATSNPANGTVDPTNDGQIVYVPNENFHGVDTFTYVIRDPSGAESDATVTVVVRSVNDDPVARNDEASTPEDTAVTINVLANDTDVDGDSLTVEVVGGPNGGEAVVNNDGTVTYTPDPGFSGQDVFTYTVDDGNGGTHIAQVSVLVESINDPPVANLDQVSTEEDTSVTISVLANDTDADGDELTILETSNPANGTATATNDGKIVYVPNENFHGVDSFVYVVSDGHGGTDSADVFVQVTPVNDAPIAEDDTASGSFTDPLTIEVLANDIDVDGDTLFVTNLGTPQSGTVTLNNDQTVVYTPDAGFAGEDSFTYTISDGVLTDTAVVTIVINDSFGVRFQQDVDDYTGTVDTFVQGAAGDADNSAAPLLNVDGSDGGAPVQALLQFTEIFGNANGQIPAGAEITNATLVLRVTNPGAALSVHRMLDLWLATDTWNSLGEGVQANGVEAVADADVVTSAVPTGSFAIDVTNSLQSWSNNPESNRGWALLPTGTNGEDFFSAEGEVPPVLEVSYRLADNTAPVAVEDQPSTDEDTPVQIDVLANDLDDDGDALSIVEVSQPENGIAEDVNGVIVYVPNENFNGTDSFTYVIEDTHGARSSTTVTVDVAPVNDNPVANRDEAVTDEDTPVTISVLDNDVDIDGDSLTVTTATQANQGTLVVNNDGTVTYTPNPNATGEDVFIYTITDGNGGADVGEVHIDIESINDPPVANNDQVSTDEDTPVTIDVLANDSDPDGELAIVNVSEPSNGRVDGGPNGIVYIPNGNFHGVDSFTYTVRDAGGLEATATVTVVVAPVNDAPVARNDEAATETGVPVEIEVLANDADVDGDTLEVIAVTSGNGGPVSINASGTVTYSPQPGFTGEDFFTYTVSDGNGGTDTAEVFVNVTGVNNTPPVAEDDLATMIDGDSVLIDVLANDSDADGDALAITDLTQPEGGQVDIVEGQVIFIPNAGFAGQTSFEYTISDGNGGTDSAEVVIDVFELDVAVFQQGLEGYEGTVDTYIRGARANRSYGQIPSLNVDGRSGRQPVHTLIRFEEIFGDAEGQIPEGAIIVSARLDLRVTNSGNPISIHRMVSEWEDTITWNTAVEGIQADGNEAEAEADVVTSRLRRGLRGIDVTTSLQAWSEDPASNLGWAFLPTGNNGVDFDSSEGLFAPRLIVEFAVPVVEDVDPGGGDNGDGGDNGNGVETPEDDRGAVDDAIWNWNEELGNRIVLERVNNRMEIVVADENDWSGLVDDLFGQLNGTF